MSAQLHAPDGGAGHTLGADDRLEILKLQALWTAVVRAGRADRAAEFCADDVVVLPPDGAPINGREAARSWLAGLNGGAVEHIEVAGVDVRGGPRSAWLTATVTTTRRSADGAAATERERRVWALVKDGRIWRVRMAGWEPAEENAASESAEDGAVEDVADEPLEAFMETGDDRLVTRIDGLADASPRRPLFARLLHRD